MTAPAGATGPEAQAAAAAASSPGTRSLTVFVGPSLRQRDLVALQVLARRSAGRVRIRPPVRRLDLLELTDGEAGTHVLIVDGEFGQSLAVSVTEIRTVLARGIRLTGASSMGALRAAECRPLGMAGTGWVYEQYRSGVVEADADVALLYDPDDYTPVTIPAVNVRWLLSRKVREGTVDAATAGQALAVATAIHFRDRRPSVLARRWARALPSQAFATVEEDLGPDRLDSWDRKRADALEAAHRLTEAVIEGACPGPDLTSDAKGVSGHGASEPGRQRAQGQ